MLVFHWDIATCGSRVRRMGRKLTPYFGRGLPNVNQAKFFHSRSVKITQRGKFSSPCLLIDISVPMATLDQGAGGGYQSSVSLCNTTCWCLVAYHRTPATLWNHPYPRNLVYRNSLNLLHTGT